jgi:hypothetical protein
MELHGQAEAEGQSVAVIVGSVLSVAPFGLIGVVIARRDGIFAMIKQHAKGISRGDLLEAMGLKGNKSSEQSVSNALNNLKKAGRIVSTDGKYAAA